MGFLSGIFGSSPSTKRYDAEPKYTPEQEELLKLLIGYYKPYVGTPYVGTPSGGTPSGAGQQPSPLPGTQQSSPPSETQQWSPVRGTGTQNTSFADEEYFTDRIHQAVRNQHPELFEESSNVAPLTDIAESSNVAPASPVLESYLGGRVSDLSELQKQGIGRIAEIEPEYYPGQQVAGLSGLEREGFARIGEIEPQLYSGQQVAGLNELQRMGLGTIGEMSPEDYGGMRETLERFVSGEYAQPKYLEDYYMKNIEEPLMERWKEDIMPTVGGEFEKRGLFMGSGRHEAELNSAETLMDTLGRSRSDIYSRMEDIGRGRQLEAVPLLSKTLSDIMGIGEKQVQYGDIPRQIEQQRLSAKEQDWLRVQAEEREQGEREVKYGEMQRQIAQQRLSAQQQDWLRVQAERREQGKEEVQYGEMQRQLAQQKLDVQYQDWLRTQPGTRPQDEVLLRLLGLNSMYPPDTVVNPGQQGLLSQAMGPAGMIGAAALMGSSVILKENIKTMESSVEKVKAISGVEFDWKEEAKKFGTGHDIGVIAEELEKVVPEAVAKVDGVNQVYYYKIIPVLVEAIKEQQLQIEALKGGNK